MRMAAQVYRVAQKNVANIVRMQRIDLRVFGAGQVVNVRRPESPG